jgi:hypothetical protein
MSVILLILGLIVAAAGTATTLFGIAINEFSLGSTLIIAGTTALTGGLILIGLSAVVTELGRVAEGLKTRGASRSAARAAEAQDAMLQPAGQAAGQPEPPAAAPAPAAAPSVRLPQVNIPPPPRSMPQAPVREAPLPDPRQPEPYPATPYPAPSAVEVSAAAIERLRSSIPRTERPRPDSPVADVEGVPLSPNGAGHHPAPPQRRPAAEVVPQPKVTADDRAGGAAAEALKASRLDFLFRSKSARPAPQAENFETLWPAEDRPGSNAPAEPEPQPRYDQVERRSEYAAPSQDRPSQDRPSQDRRPEPAPANEPHAAAILKSGVVDGMAYTLYADGSIEAKLPHGTVRFGSIAELRAHIENNS